MAQNRLIFCLDARLQLLTERNFLPSFLLVPFRGKKSAKKQKKAKKDQKLQEMKDFVKRRELQKLLESASLKAAVKGEPFDPEMLNPARKRPPPTLSVSERESRILLYKKWSRYQMQKNIEQLQLLRGMMKSREKALRELKNISPFLHSKALELNPDLFPLECRAPTQTPPIPSYVPPDPEE